MTLVIKNIQKQCRLEEVLYHNGLMFLIDAKIAFFVCFLKASLVVGGKGCGKPCTVMAVQTRIGKPRKIREGFDFDIF